MTARRAPPSSALVSNVSFDAAGAGTDTLTTDRGRFLVYAPSPDATEPGGLTFSFEEYEKTYPDEPAPENTGNGVLYAANVPATSPLVTVEQAATQADPASDAAIRFDVTFDQDVTGFDASDVDLGLSTAGASLAAELAGGPASYTLTVTGMDTEGDVVASIPAGACQGTLGGLANEASSSNDNVVAWSSGAIAAPPEAPAEESCTCATVGAGTSGRTAGWLAAAVLAAFAATRRRWRW